MYYIFMKENSEKSIALKLLINKYMNWDLLMLYELSYKYI